MVGLIANSNLCQITFMEIAGTKHQKVFGYYLLITYFQNNFTNFDLEKVCQIEKDLSEYPWQSHVQIP